MVSHWCASVNAFTISRKLEGSSPRTACVVYYLSREMIERENSPVRVDMWCGCE